MANMSIRPKGAPTPMPTPNTLVVLELLGHEEDKAGLGTIGHDVGAFVEVDAEELDMVELIIVELDAVELGVLLLTSPYAAIWYSRNTMLTSVSLSVKLDVGQF